MSNDLLHSSTVDSSGNVVEGSTPSLNLFDNDNAQESATKVEEAAQKEIDKSEPKKEVPVKAKEFAALARKEKALREEKARFAKEMADMKAELEALKKPKAEPVKEPLDVRLKKNPLEALAEIGMPYEKLTDLVLNNGKLPLEEQLHMIKEELESKSKSEVEQLKKQIEEQNIQRQKEQEEHVINNFKLNITKFIEAPEYSVLADLGGADLVYDKIEEVYSQHGKVLEIKEAADLLKSDFESKIKTLAEKLGLLKPVQKVADKPIAAPSNSATLSNKTATNLSAGSKPNMSLEEAKKAAANLLQWSE